MRKFITLLLVLSAFYGNAQNGNSICAGAIQICFEDTVSFPAAVNAGAAEAGPDYGCLGARPNPAWFYFQTQMPGTHTFTITNSNDQDLDFIIYGPFSSMTDVCDNLDSSAITTCSYAGGATETANFTSEAANDYYLLLITNFSNNHTTVILNQTAGSGSFACNFVPECMMSLGTPVLGTCDTLTNQHSVSGLVYSFNPPTTGTLTITAGTHAQVIQAPFNNAQTYLIEGLISDGQTSEITAVFSANPSCSAVIEYTAHSNCIPCQAIVISNSPVCENENLFVSVSFEDQATYHWTGPNGYTNEDDHIQILDVTSANAGTYTVFISSENCSATRSFDIEIIPEPVATIFDPGEIICQGDILFLGAAEIAGAAYSWSGPQIFTSGNRNNQINNVQPDQSGIYNLIVSVGDCFSQPASLDVIIHPSPVISISGDTAGTPGGTSVFVASGSDGNEYFWNFYGSNTIVENTIYTNQSDTVVVFWKEEQAVIQVEVIGKDSSGCFSSPVSMNIHVSGWVGINGSLAGHEMEIYPNPANDVVRITNNRESDRVLKMTDVTGKMVWSGKLQAAGSILLPLNGFATGMYFLGSTVEQKWQRLVITR